MRKKVPRTEEFDFVGMQYRLTKSSRNMIFHGLPIQCELERETDNAHDENAIKVVISKNADSGFKGMHIGYMRRQVATVMAPALDSGAFQIKECWLTELDVDKGEGKLTLKMKTPG